MAEVVLDAQAVLLATVLFAACLTKLLIREPAPSRPDLQEPGPAPPPEVHGASPPEQGWTVALRQNRTVIVSLSLAEAGLAIALLLTPHAVVRVVAVLLFAAATWVVIELRARKPDSGCGCFGGLSSKRIGRRSVVRAGLLTVAAISSLGGTESGLRAMESSPTLTSLIVVLELAIFAGLSPEIGVLWSRTHQAPVPCERRRSRLSETFGTLHSSAAWREHRRLLTENEPLDVWREHCWRLLVYPARLDDQAIELVFAVSTAERDRTVKVAVVEPDWEPLPDDGFDDGGRHRIAVQNGGELRKPMGSEDTGPNSHYATL